ncbi:glutathione S-transferase [Psychrobacter sp. Sarcosine-3u-12]|uniref:glutathione S-transferase n=1 Tax=Psychrobacter sp. Sarcosine-3u-12 TaxID=2058325 RepID=UPI000C33A96D|nr:glutathione S-transferase [Psychrobacter sp. Sarcosine-3u-12]PKG34813.1 glutathione S-transferase [Psychrobacter sp. Sarcosine-3u-12]
MTVPLHRLYSFRRCPYAMRARLGILFAELQVELREITLKNKPMQMLAISPKATVPVLQLADGRVIEESREIMEWVLEQQDPQRLLDSEVLQQANALIDKNDNEFKHWLDRYKYADRHPEMTQTEYRQRGEAFLQVLEELLTQNPYLLGDSITIADIGVMPFVRQFAHVDRDVFYDLPYPNLQRWLQYWLAHPLFLQAMSKYQPWQEEDDVVLFPS